jgi:hypothetical protein
MGRDCWAGIATCYRLHCPGIEYRRGEIFRTRPDRSWDPPILLYYNVSFPGKSLSVAFITHPHLSAEIKGRVEIFVSSPGPIMACSRVNFAFTSTDKTHCCYEDAPSSLVSIEVTDLFINSRSRRLCSQYDRWNAGDLEGGYVTVL